MNRIPLAKSKQKVQGTTRSCGRNNSRATIFQDICQHSAVGSHGPILMYHPTVESRTLSLAFVLCFPGLSCHPAVARETPPKIAHSQSLPCPLFYWTFSLDPAHGGFHGGYAGLPMCNQHHTHRQTTPKPRTAQVKHKNLP